MTEETAAGTTEPQAAPQIQMRILGQFIRDMSFENVMAQKGVSGDVQPEISVQVNLDAKKRSADHQYEVSIKLNLKSKAKGLEDILFLDIETVPEHASYEELSEEARELWEHKTRYQRKEEFTGEEFYDRAGIWAEFGMVVCISAGFFQRTGSEKVLRIRSFTGPEDRILREFSDLLEEYFRSPGKLLCAHNGKEFDFPYLAASPIREDAAGERSVARDLQRLVPTTPNTLPRSPNRPLAAPNCRIPPPRSHPTRGWARLFPGRGAPRP